MMILDTAMAKGGVEVRGGLFFATADTWIRYRIATKRLVTYPVVLESTINSEVDLLVCNTQNSSNAIAMMRKQRMS